MIGPKTGGGGVKCGLVPTRAFPAASSILGLVLAILLGRGSAAEAGLPILIQRQPDNVQRAWIEIDKIVDDNKKLNEPLPEPYMARGELWSRVGSHEDAMSDYLLATELFFRGNPTPQ